MLQHKKKQEQAFLASFSQREREWEGKGGELRSTGEAKKREAAKKRLEKKKKKAKLDNHNSHKYL